MTRDDTIVEPRHVNIIPKTKKSRVLNIVNNDNEVKLNNVSNKNLSYTMVEFYSLIVHIIKEQKAPSETKHICKSHLDHD